MSLETLDKSNVQKLVDNIGQKNDKLDKYEDELGTTLIEFTKFFSIETEMFEEVEENGIKVKKEILIPYQFKLENHAKFKTFSIPISRSLWAFPKVVSHMRQELYRHETPMPNLTNIPMMAQQEGGGENTGILSGLKNIGRKLYKDPNSPYNATRELMDYYSEIPGKWINMVHIYELSIRNRPRINTRRQLDKIMNDLVIAFNALIEPNLVHVLHYAHILLKSETEDRIVNLLTTYNQIAERHEKMMMMMGPNAQQTF